MGLPNETSWECEMCGVFNISEGIIRKGKMYCQSCWNKINRNSQELRTKEDKR
jgi:predicted Zn-dependent protease